jgi:hypothetical protein
MRWVRGLVKILFEEVGFEMFSEDGQGLCCTSFMGFHLGARIEKCFDWAE